MAIIAMLKYVNDVAGLQEMHSKAQAAKCEKDVCKHVEIVLFENNVEYERTQGTADCSECSCAL